MKEYVEMGLLLDAISVSKLDYLAVADVVCKVPTADVVEVKHGEWISLHNGRYKCSCCGMDWKLIGSPEANGMYYCLNCGAKMEMEDEQIY